MELKGKVAFVTGGTRGIGLAVAERLAERGADIVISYFRSRQSANEAVEKIKSLWRGLLRASRQHGES